MRQMQMTDDPTIRQKLLDCLLSGQAERDFPEALVQATGLSTARLDALLRKLFTGGLAELGRCPEMLHGRMPKTAYRNELGKLPETKVFVDRQLQASGSVSVVYGTGQSWYGDCLVATTEKGICWLDLQPGPEAVQKLQAAIPGAGFTRNNNRALELAEQVFSSPGQSIAVHLIGTSFQAQVWQALLRIPAASCMSYGQLAKCIAAPLAARAVGRAVGSNRIAVLVPCHRVLPATGMPGGFRWGTDIKWAMLLREKMHDLGATQQAA